MTISDYADLQARVADFLVRTDLSAQIPTFIRLAEADMQRRVRHWKMERRALVVLSSGVEVDISNRAPDGSSLRLEIDDDQFANLPADWMETKRLFTDRPLEPVSLDWIAEQRKRLGNTPGVPKYYTHTTGQIEVLPKPATPTPATLLYYATIPFLSANNPTNWLLETAPDVYLYGALMHSSGLLQEDERIATWGGLYADAVRSLNGNDNSVSGTGLRMR